MLTDLNKTGLFSEIDLHFGRFISRFSVDATSEIFLAAALTSRATGNGDICLKLDSACESLHPDVKNGHEPLNCPPIEQWRKALLASPAVGIPGDRCPLILDDRNRLYLYRYWEYEKKLAESIQRRVKANIQSVDLQNLKGHIDRIFPENGHPEINWQKTAAIIAVLRRFSVITGGPGSGKTFLIARILALLLEMEPAGKLRIRLAAPTGKAAARLGESIRESKQILDCSKSVKDGIPDEVYTIHRLLKPVSGTPYFYHGSDNPLPADVVVVDEASMVDLALMSKLVRAVPDQARLILLGDKDQLASVEAGSVLADICDRNVLQGVSKSFAKRIETVSGGKTRDSIRPVSKNNPLQDCIVVLPNSYRFSFSGGIGGLSRAVNRGDADEALDLLKDPAEESISWHEVRSHAELLRGLAKKIIGGYSNFLTLDDPLLALTALNRYRILCALKIGPFGAGEINTFAEQILTQQHLVQPGSHGEDSPWYRGRPVLITSNDYNLGLFNGDIGITMPDRGSGSSALYVFFPGDSGKIRRFSPHRLGEHETVYAMTVHKSQGSEFDAVLLILPDKDYPVLTRELIYTGLTRARKKVSVWGRQAVLETAIKRRIDRTSGLRDALWD